MLTVPRKLSVIDGKLLQEPLYCGKKIAESLSPAIADKTVCGVIEISVEELKELTLKLRVKGGNRTLITVTENRLIFDRSRSGEEITGKESDEYSVAGIREMPLDKRRLHKLIVVMDLFSVEIFADGKSLSSVICPPLDADGIELSADAASCKYVRYDVSDCMGIK